jgi:hypothetical protein
MTKISYKGYRFPPEIIQQTIWLYLRFTLSFRDVEDLLAERGIIVSYESVRRWVNHFGPMIAADLRKRRPKPHTTWHLDEVYLKIDGRMVLSLARHRRRGRSPRCAGSEQEEQACSAASATFITEASVGAAKKVLHEAIDFAFLDVDVTKGKTFEIAEILEGNHVPYAFISASCQDQLPLELRRAPFIRKPFYAAQIKSALQAIAG